MALKMLVFACVGVAMEVVFTAVVDWPKRRSWRLMGQSYVWMLPIYALIPVLLALLRPYVGVWPLAGRLAAYTALLLALEYATGRLLHHAVGEAPWEAEYRGKRWAVGDVMRLDYAPLWALACWLFETLDRALSSPLA